TPTLTGSVRTTEIVTLTVPRFVNRTAKCGNWNAKKASPQKFFSFPKILRDQFQKSFGVIIGSIRQAKTGSAAALARRSVRSTLNRKSLTLRTFVLHVQC